jgi:A/G-specific adenine glycosylase
MNANSMSSEKVKYFRKKVVEFYLKRGRRWPWRESRDPYVTLVTELLLQKTTATQVMQIYNEFFARFTTIEVLASASEEEIAKIVAKLGLRKRARFLKEIAERIVKEFGGRIPDNRDALLSLKGVGMYTANAVLSFAYGRCVPVVDRNVARVIRRYFGIESDKPAYSDKALWEFAEKIMPQSMCREFNYGIIDLGAMVCLPEVPRTSRGPKCYECPLKEMCSYAKARH